MRTLVTLTLSLLVSSTAVSAAAVDPYANPPSPVFAGQTMAPTPEQASSIEVEVLVTGLQLPRSLVALPDGNMIMAEGSGEVRIIGRDGTLSERLEGMPAIRSVAGRSLADFIIDTNFAENRRVYFTYQAPPAGEAGGVKTAEDRNNAAEQGAVFQINQIATARLSADLRRVEDVQIISDIPGRRLISAPDGTLYITTVGAGGNRPAVQDLATVLGKVLRINPDGSIPANNPLAGGTSSRQEIFEIGHRDPDGGFIHPQTGELWMIEHGPMGGDEINIIRSGQNSGWPDVTYGKNYDGTEIGPSTGTGTEQPLYYWFPSVAPSGLMMYTGDLFPQWQGNIFLGTMSPTEGKYLVRLIMDNEAVVAEEHLLVGNDRRVRTITQGTDGALYVLTDSEDNNQTNRHFVGQVLKLTPGN
jgi:aldose sugar dehydrogenase